MLDQDAKIGIVVTECPEETEHRKMGFCQSCRKDVPFEMLGLVRKLKRCKKCRDNVKKYGRK